MELHQRQLRATAGCGVVRRNSLIHWNSHTLFGIGSIIGVAEMSSRLTFPPKLAGETISLPFDFTAKLASGETISTQAVVAAVYSGVDASPASLISGLATSSGSTVSQNITGGVLGTIYYVTCTITTSLGLTKQMTGYLAIQSLVP